MQKERTFYLVGGPNGSGKSTFVRRAIKSDDVAVLDLDDIALSRNVSSITAARQLLEEDLPRVLNSGQSFVLESTLSGTYDARVIQMAHDSRYTVEFVFAFLESVEQNIERVAQRVRNGGHNVDTDVIYRRYEKSLHNFRKIVPLVDKWSLIYNGEDGKSYNVACGKNEITCIEHKDYYALFCDNCFDASVRRIMHYIEIGATPARLRAEGIGTSVPFCALEKLILPRQR